MGAALVFTFGLLNCAPAAAQVPTQIALSFAPASIVADGVSTSTVTAVVTDQSGQGVPGLNVSMSATDAAGNHPLMSAVQGVGNGDYVSTLTSSPVAGPVSVFADVQTPFVYTAKQLTQMAISTTSVTAVAGTPVSSANLPVTNQSVSLIATVTASPGNVVPSGNVTFEDHGLTVNGCGGLALPAGSTPSLTVACGAAFDAARSPASLTAVFSPTPSSLVLASASPPEVFAVGRGPTSSVVALSPTTRTAKVDSPVTYAALVTSSPLGPVLPAGSVAFIDDGRTISACAARPLGPFPIATCTVRYASVGSHAITALYLGNASFAASTSAPTPVAVQPLGTTNATMHWSFSYTPAYTTVQTLVIAGVPAGADVIVKCHGRGCAHRRRVITTPKPRRCRAHARGRCRNSYEVDLASRFRAVRLAPGTMITVEVRRRGWVGKSFSFVIRSGRSPRVRIAPISAGAR
jgi:hypothetical protein